MKKIYWAVAAVLVLGVGYFAWQYTHSSPQVDNGSSKASNSSGSPTQATGQAPGNLSEQVTNGNVMEIPPLDKMSRPAPAEVIPVDVKQFQVPPVGAIKPVSAVDSKSTNEVPRFVVPPSVP